MEETLGGCTDCEIIIQTRHISNHTLLTIAAIAFDYFIPMQNFNLAIGGCIVHLFHHYKVRKARVDTRNAVSFCVNLSRLAPSKLLLTSANNLLKASFSFA